ncbi:TMPS9 protease, partial [Atractosteus spatula]|nr:TMPS9 protease [Atractosteus spatula]
MGQYWCGGSLINSNWVLTSAACFRWSTSVASYWTVYLGRQTQLGSNPHEVSRGVQTIILYPISVDTLYNNIALVKLSSPVNFTDYIQPICLANVNSSFHRCTSCWLTGWGNMTDGTSLPGNQTLQQVQLPIIEITDCMNQTNAIYNFKLVTETMICTGETPKNSSCTNANYASPGITGSPLVCKQGTYWIQAGVLNFRNYCPEYLVSYAGVSNYNSWIKAQVGSNSVEFVEFNNNSIFTTAPSTTTAPVAVTSSTIRTATVTPSDALPIQVCGRPKLNTSLLAGQSAAEGSWPWMASLQRNGRHVCGGTLVTGDWVMTTAQCLSSPVTVQEWTVILGRLKQNGSNPFERSLGVQSFQTSQLGGTNIALLKLNAKVSFTDYIQPICLAGERVSFPTGAQCWVTGWGNAAGTVLLSLIKELHTNWPSCTSVCRGTNIGGGIPQVPSVDSAIAFSIHVLHLFAQFHLFLYVQWCFHGFKQLILTLMVKNSNSFLI